MSGCGGWVRREARCAMLFPAMLRHFQRHTIRYPDAPCGTAFPKALVQAGAMVCLSLYSHIIPQSKLWIHDFNTWYTSPAPYKCDSP